MPVYMVRSGLFGCVKIGVAKDVLRRLSGLQTSHPHKLKLIRALSGERDVEAALHTKFSHLRQAGEWFTFDESMMSKDIGFDDLPLPFKRRNYRQHDTSTAYGRFAELTDFFEEILGNQDKIAELLGVEPFHWWAPSCRMHLSAIALLMRQAGYPEISYFLVKRRMDEKVAEQDAETHDREKAEAIRSSVARVNRIGAGRVWWELSPDVQAALDKQRAQKDQRPSDEIAA